MFAKIQIYVFGGKTETHNEHIVQRTYCHNIDSEEGQYQPMKKGVR